MTQVIYIEVAIKDHPRVHTIVSRFPQAKQIFCDHYGEVFNPKSQNFRLQKQNPCLILAEKKGKKVLPTPEGFGIGGEQNYYFSHMLNCLYDCRYCFLQGLYHSANQVIFVNYEDFMADIRQKAQANAQPSYFFSGYDCDSLAYEPVTEFLQTFLPFFAQMPKAILELRTKSTNIRSLLNQKPFKNCVVAFSLTPDQVAQAVEHKAPSVAKRIQAMQTLSQQGWQIGLRFDPMIYVADFKTQYQQLVTAIFAQVDSKSIHSVSIGPLRFPQKMFQKLVKLYPNDALLAQSLVKHHTHICYDEKIEKVMKDHLLELLDRYLDKARVFECISVGVKQ